MYCDKQYEQIGIHLNYDVLSLLEQKQPEGRVVNEDFVFEGPSSIMIPSTDESQVLKAAHRMKGWFWTIRLRRWWLENTSNFTGLRRRHGRYLRTAEICTEDIQDKFLEAFLVCRLRLLN